MIEIIPTAVFVAACYAALCLATARFRPGIGFGGGGGGRSVAVPSSQTVTNQVSIPPELVPFVERQSEIGTAALERLPGLIGEGERLTVPFDPLEAAAQEARLAAAAGFDPSAAFAAARTPLEAAARGDFLFGGAGFDRAVEAAVNRASPFVLSTFGQAGRGTGGLAQAAIAQQATDAFAGLFNQERGRQLTAASLLPELELAELRASLVPSEIQAGVGGARRSLALQEQLAPVTAQETLLQAAGGGVPLGALLGQTQTSTGVTRQPLFSNTGAGVLGGGVAGAGIGQALGFSGFGALAPFAAGGALLGGLFS